jgi:hypothetical protein
VRVPYDRKCFSDATSEFLCAFENSLPVHTSFRGTATANFHELPFEQVIRKLSTLPSQIPQAKSLPLPLIQKHDTRTYIGSQLIFIIKWKECLI